jgi:hypothetical protein
MNCSIIQNQFVTIFEQLFKLRYDVFIVIFIPQTIKIQSYLLILS